MLLPGGPFEHFSGSLVVVGPNRTVLYCNPAGKALAALLQGPDSPQLRAAVEGAFNGRPAQFSPFRPGGQDQPGAVLDLTVMPWDGGAAVVLLGRDITFERAQRDALRGELARARRKVHFNHTLTDLLTKGLDLDLLADVMLRGLVGSLDLAGAQLLEACPPPGRAVGRWPQPARPCRTGCWASCKPACATAPPSRCGATTSACWRKAWRPRPHQTPADWCW